MFQLPKTFLTPLSHTYHADIYHVAKHLLPPFCDESITFLWCSGSGSHFRLLASGGLLQPPGRYPCTHPSVSSTQFTCIFNTFKLDHVASLFKILHWFLISHRGKAKLEGLMLKLKLQYFGKELNAKNWLIGKEPDAGKDWRWEEQGTTEDGITDSMDMSLSGLGELVMQVCYGPWGRKGSEKTDWLHWTEWIDKALRSVPIISLTSSPPLSSSNPFLPSHPRACPSLLRSEFYEAGSSVHVILHCIQSSHSGVWHSSGLSISIC